MAQAYHVRAIAYANAGDIEAAITNVHRSVELDQMNGGAQLLRVRLYVEAFNYLAAGSAIRHYEEAVNGASFASHLWTWYIDTLKGEGPEAASRLKEFSENSREVSGSWRDALIAYALRTIDEETFLKAFDSEGARDHLYHAHFVIGIQAALAAQADKAAKHFQQCVAIGNPGSVEYAFALSELNRDAPL